jgi:thiamine pyrophosphokinase
MTFSAIPLAEGTVVSERGMHWNLDRRPLALLADEGVSNVVEATDACVTCHEGVLAAFLLR